MESSRHAVRRSFARRASIPALCGAALALSACGVPGGGAWGKQESPAAAPPGALAAQAGGDPGRGTGLEAGPGRPEAQAGRGQRARPADDTVTVTASRREQSTYDTPWAITVAGRREIERKSQLTILDTLDDRAGIWVEKHTSTKSDPVMRGFSGGNLLALVDGCSLTSMWGEGGFATDDMYGKVDAESIERIEVIRGPGSALYGSNALGGVINFITRSCPLDYTEEGIAAGGRTKLGYGSNPNYYLFRQEGYLATPEFRFFLGGSRRKAGDVEGGRGMGTQTPTSGADLNFDFKGSWRFAEDNELELAAQVVNRDDLYRFYRPTQRNFNERNAVTLAWRAKDAWDLLDSLEAKAYFQDKRDVRWDPSNNRDGEAKWRTWSGDVRGVRALGEAHTLTAGIHYHLDLGQTPDDEQFAWTDRTTGLREKVSPDAAWDDIGLYLQDEWEAAEGLTVTGAARYDRFQFESDVDGAYARYVGNPANKYPAGYDPETDAFSDSHQVFSGGLGAVYHIVHGVHLVGNYTRGFRLFPPRFGIVQTGYGVLVPEEFEDAITNDTFELGAKFNTEEFKGSAFVWYSAVDNWQTIAAGSYQGQDWFDFNANSVRDPGEDVYRTETGRAELYGFEADGALRLAGAAQPLGREAEQVLEGWLLKGAYTWNWGDDFAAKKGRGGQTEPMRHTQPMRLVLALAWEDDDPERNGWFELKADMVAAYDRIPSDRWASDVGYYRDPQSAASGKIRSHKHLPGYTVLTVRGGLDLCKDVSLTGAVENLTDKKYRRAHSRWDEAGINFLTTLTVRF